MLVSRNANVQMAFLSIAAIEQLFYSHFWLMTAATTNSINVLHISFFCCCCISLLWYVPRNSFHLPIHPYGCLAVSVTNFSLPAFRISLLLSGFLLCSSEKHFSDILVDIFDSLRCRSLFSLSLCLCLCFSFSFWLAFPLLVCSIRLPALVSLAFQLPKCLRGENVFLFTHCKKKRANK